jgi:hypothetical protein
MFKYACVTCTNVTELRVVAHMGSRPTNAVTKIHEGFVGLVLLNDAINNNIDDHRFVLDITHSN